MKSAEERKTSAEASSNARSSENNHVYFCISKFHNYNIIIAGKRLSRYSRHSGKQACH